MTQSADRGHIPVMAERVVELLGPALSRDQAVYLDATLGLGGHAARVLERHPRARLIGLDRDPAALARARRRLAPFADRIALVEAVYDELPQVLADLDVPTVDAVLFDLGLSSLQIDDLERGFAYATDAPLDMRMSGPGAGATAADLVNQASPVELARIIRRHGQERFADRIAAAIVKARAQAPFERSAALVEVIAAAIPAAARHSGGHPAKRTFQALRIAVNQEDESLAAALPAGLAALGLGGRIVVLSYHSGEDRLVKRTLAAASRDQVPPGLVEVPEAHRARFQLLTSRAERPTAAELADNPRSASARLRAATRIKEVAP
ncbi:MAG: 16S rRNA (cytosine(1402)-N(4))-methyltransferase RsmH [Propionibacteriaceae bacterium]|jgi:16S rRNA (cytosine1402-N4)-methyltransferase|nr:16S rRNA (cytosine(1402)-N(4))-methyltransferase RsmH [Propionibacteriaceae bacterium]